MLASEPDDDGATRLLSPEVGRFTGVLGRGQLLVTGTEAGQILALGETIELVVPKGVSGRIVSEPPALVRHPVGYGDVLYELAALEGASFSAPVEAPAAASGLLSFRAPHSGRFWHRPSPGEPAFVGQGDIVTAGDTIGLIEVMKTFSRLDYQPGDDLPRRARIVRLLISDGDEVTEGDPLFEIEKA